MRTHATVAAAGLVATALLLAGCSAGPGSGEAPTAGSGTSASSADAAGTSDTDDAGSPSDAETPGPTSDTDLPEVTSNGADGTTSTIETRDAGPTDPVEMLTRAVAASQALPSSRTTSATVTSIPDQVATVVCSAVTLEKNDDGSTQAMDVEVSMGTASTSDLSTACRGATTLSHFVVIGSDGWVRSTAAGGKFRRVTLSEAALSELSNTYGQPAQQYALLVDNAAEVKVVDDQTVTIRVEGVEALAALGQAAGAGEDALTGMDDVSAEWTVHISPDTGVVDRADATVDMAGKNLTATATTRVDQVVPAPDRVAPPADVTSDAPVAVESITDLTTAGLQS